MFDQYLGSYLLRRNLISTDALREAMECEKEYRVKLGILAIDQGFMTSGQVEDIHNQQKQKDRKFGELAIENGYLTQENVDQLLLEQKEAHVSLGQVLIDQGLFSLADIERILEEYKRDAGLSGQDLTALRKGDVTVVVDKILGFSRAKKYYRDYLILFVRNVIRFLDPYPQLTVEENEENHGDVLFIQQDLKGKYDFRTALLFQSEDAQELASRFSKEDIPADDPLIPEALKEFLNLHNGIFAVNLSNEGLHMELQPPFVQTSIEDGYTETIVVNTEGGQLKLYLD